MVASLKITLHKKIKKEGFSCSGVCSTCRLLLCFGRKHVMITGEHHPASWITDDNVYFGGTSNIEWLSRVGVLKRMQ